jgi:cytochrome P450
VLLLPYNVPPLPFWRYLRLSRRLDDAIRAMIDQKRTRGRDEGDVLSMLVHTRDQDGARMSEDELIGQANLLFLAGHETTANALAWTLFLLMQHPGVMADLCDELHGTLRGDPPRADQLAELPLLERVIKESLRILPPVPFGARVAMAPTALGPYELPPLTEIAFSEYVTHHLPELYPEPERFRPDRWKTAEPSAYEYLPFGAGPRMCVGATFAMIEAKVVLAMLLQRYRPELVPGARVDRHINITLSPRYGLPVVIRAQDRNFAASRAEVRGDVHDMVDLTEPAAVPVG